MKIKVKSLKSGDMIDLENDPYADPLGLHQEYIFDYAVVESVEQETAACIAVTIEGGDIVGFPPEHEVEVIHEF